MDRSAGWVYVEAGAEEKREAWQECACTLFKYVSVCVCFFVFSWEEVHSWGPGAFTGTAFAKGQLENGLEQDAAVVVDIWSRYR